MTIAQFLALFPVTKETKKGWDVCCPAHADTRPSLGILDGEDGKIVLNCWAGCTTTEICAALGLSLSDLFADRTMPGPARPILAPPKPMNRTKIAFAYELHALDCRMQAEKILAVASECTDCDTWTDDDRTLAMQAVVRAYTYRDRALFCERYADHIREEHYESQRLASGQPRTGGASA